MRNQMLDMRILKAFQFTNLDFIMKVGLKLFDDIDSPIVSALPLSFFCR